MNLFKGQYTLKTVSLESGFSTKEVFLADTPERTLLSYLGELFIPTLFNTLPNTPYIPIKKENSQKVLGHTNILKLQVLI